MGEVDIGEDKPHAAVNENARAKESPATPGRKPTGDAVPVNEVIPGSTNATATITFHRARKDRNFPDGGEIPEREPEEIITAESGREKSRLSLFVAVGGNAAGTFNICR